MKTAKDILLEIAAKDLKASEVLYNQRLYSQAYFCFQQASEKANKAFGLIGNIISNDDLLGIGHDQMKIYKRALVKREVELGNFISIFNESPAMANAPFVKDAGFAKYHSSVKNSVLHIDSLKNYDLLKLSNGELNNLLIQLDELYELKFDTSVVTTQILKDHWEAIIAWVGTIETPEAKQGKLDMEKILSDKNMMQEMVNVIRLGLINIIDSSFIGSVLYACAFITIQHSSKSRYPFENHNPLTIYNKKLPIVRMQPEFMWYLEKAISKIKKMNKQRIQ